MRNLEREERRVAEREAEAEFLFELAANFEPGETVVNVITGESWTVPEARTAELSEAA